MNGLYEIALHTVVMVWFWWILMLTVLGIINIAKDIVKLIRKNLRKSKETDND